MGKRTRDISGEEQIDVEVQISRIAQQEVEQVMRGDLWQNTNVLRYYVGRESKAVVQRAYRQVLKRAGIVIHD